MANTFGDANALIPGLFNYAEVEAQGPTDYTLVAIDEEQVGQEGKLKAVARFKETRKGVVVNVTRGKALTELFGAAATIAGKRVRVYASVENVNGKSIPMVMFGEAEG